MHTDTRVRLDHLPTWGKKGLFNVVVEAPRGSRIKFKYDPKLRAVTWGHPLPVGFQYPFDWGFIPSTLGEDGDPLDALVLSEVPSYPGVVIPCRPFGLIALEERDGKNPERNDRLVVVPAKGGWTNEMKDTNDLPDGMRSNLEHFFLSSVYFSSKRARCLGWKGPKAALKHIATGVERAKKKQTPA
jgi:inorganic pyrophosphatase